MDTHASQSHRAEKGDKKKKNFDSCTSLEELRDTLDAQAGSLKDLDGKVVDAKALENKIFSVESMAKELQLAELHQEFESFRDIPELKKKVIDLANARVLNECKKNQFLNVESLEDFDSLFLYLAGTGVPKGFESDGFDSAKVRQYLDAMGDILKAPVFVNPAINVFKGNEDVHSQIVDLISKHPMQAN